jgi:hypothetical protein
MIWYPGKAAFRVGGITGTYTVGNGPWDDANIGQYSFAAGLNSKAAGAHGVAIGYGATSANTYNPNVAIGQSAQANSYYGNALALGSYASASGFDSDLAVGVYASASGGRSSAVGYFASTTQEMATAIGGYATAGGYASNSIGYYANASNGDSIAIGSYTVASGLRSTALGYSTTARAYASTVIGQHNAVDTPNATQWVWTDPLFIIGNGTGSGATNISKSNALVVYKNGNAEFKGTLRAEGRDVVTTSAGAASTFLGNVGIGTSSPTNKLEVTSGAIGIVANSLAGQSRMLNFYEGRLGNWTSAGIDLLNPGVAYGGGLAFNYHPVNYTPDSGLVSGMVLNAWGNVGIGTVSPRAKLEVAGSVIQRHYSEGLGSMGFGTYHEGSPGGIIAGMEIEHAQSNGGMSNRIHLNSHLHNGSFGRRVTIDYNGNVGIGTTNPQGKLHVAGSFAGGVLEDGADRPSVGLSGQYPQVTMMAGGTGNLNHGPTVMLGSYNSGTSGASKHWSIGTSGQDSTFLDIGYAENDVNPHAGIRNYGGTTVMTLVNSGRIGVGTTNPQAKLHVAGNARFDGRVRLAPQGDIDMGGFQSEPPQ